MDDRVSFPKPKIAVLAAFIYTVIMGAAMFYMKAFRGSAYGDPEMMTIALDFLANPNQTPDSRCLTQVKPIFVVE